MARIKTILFVFLIVFLAVNIAYSLLASVTIPNYGIIKAININIYQDSNCTATLTNIEWGIIEPNSTITYEAWLQNKGNVPVTLTLYTENWNPLNASDYISLIWNCEDVAINMDEIISCVFTLEIYPNVTGITNFSFYVLMVGEA